MNKDLKENWKKTFAIIWAGQAASLLTSAIIQSAIVWHIAAETGSATVLSVAAMFGYIPMAVFGPFIGSLIDRWPRKRIMIAADLFIALTSAFLAVLAFDGELGIFAICSALLARAIGTAFHSPCLQAVTPMIVPKDQLARCGGYSYTLQSVALVASPAIAAALYPILPFWMLMLLDVVGAACGILTIAVCRIPELEPSEPRPLRLVFSEAYEGLQSMRQIKGLLALTVIGSLFSLAYIPVASLYPLMSMSYFGGTTTHAGIVEAAFSGGMVLGGLTLGIWGGTKNKMKEISAATLVMGLTLVAMGLLRPSGFVLFAILTLATGFSAPFFSTPFMAIYQQKVPAEVLGRVLGISGAMMTLACPLGLAMSGLFAERIGITNWFILSGGLTLACFVMLVGFRSTRRLDVEDKK